MSIRSIVFSSAVAMAAVACMDPGTDASADDQTAAVTQNGGGGGGFACSNKNSIQGVGCVGSIAVLPINVDVKNVGVLDNNQLNVLSGDLNNLSIKDINVLDNDKILNDVQATVLQDFLNKFLINVSNNDIDVCTTVLGILLCK
jgi:hypothetical protein